MLRKVHNTFSKASLALRCAKIGIVVAITAVVIMSGFAPMHDDLGAYHLPLRAFYQQCLAHSLSWDWCPALFGGYFVHGEGQIGGDHPLHQILYRVLPLSAAFTIETLIAYPLLIGGMYFWLRRMNVERKTALFTAISCGLCGFVTLRVVHPNATQVLAHIPWLLGCLVGLQQATNRKTKFWFFAASSLLTGSQLLLGYPQYVLYSLIAELVLCFWLNREASVATQSVAIHWVMAKLFGIMLGAAQAWPTLEYLATSERAGLGWDKTNAVEGSWHPLNLIQYFAPYLFTTRVVGQNTHELSCYLGAIPWILATIGIVASHLSKTQQSMRRLGWFLIGAGLLISLGEHFPVSHFISSLPVMNKLRFPCRAMILVELGLLVLATIGLCRISGTNDELTTRERRTIFVVPIVGFIFTLIANVVWREWTNTIAWQLTGLAVFVFSAAAIFYFRSSRKYFVPAITVLAIADLAFYAATMPNWSDWQKISNITPGFATFWSNPERVVPYAGWRERIAFQAGQAPIHVANRMIWEPTEFSREPVANLNGYAGVKPREDFKYKTAWPGVSKLIVNDDSSSKAMTNVLPRVGVIDVKKTTDADMRGEIEWDAEVAPLELTRDLPGRISCRINEHQPLDSDGTRLVTTTESWHKDWIARADGRIVPTVRINQFAVGCRVPSDAQFVEFRFESASHKLGRTVSLCALSLLCLYGAGSYFSARTSLRKENDGHYVS